MDAYAIFLLIVFFKIFMVIVALVTLAAMIDDGLQKKKRLETNKKKD